MQTLGTSNYVMDSIWLSTLFGYVPDTTSPHDFLKDCFDYPFIEGYVLYDYENQQDLLPNVITLAGQLNAIPISSEDPAILNMLPRRMTQLRDLKSEWKHHTPYTATKDLAASHLQNTTGLCKMNPGYDASTHILNPDITHDPDINLVDHMISSRLFTMYLTENCVPHTRDHALMETIATSNPWPRPIGVFGYDDTIPIFGGDLFEAETNCVKEHNMGQIASVGFNNLSFFARLRRILGGRAGGLEQAPRPGGPLEYDPERSYVALIVGDGDNIQYAKNRNYIWQQARTSRCLSSPASCFPLVWTASPRLPGLAPGILDYYYDAAAATGRDYFVLPPSGSLYSYPAAMNPADRDTYVSMMLSDFEALDTTASVHWEWFYEWEEAFEGYFPKFSRSADQDPVGFFLTDVPFDVPMYQWGSGDIKVVGEFENVVLFRPHEWRGVSGKGFFDPTPGEMARRLNGAERGTVKHVYLTSDGGLSLDSVYEMVEALDDHVTIVDHRTLIDAALQKHKQESKR